MSVFLLSWWWLFGDTPPCQQNTAQHHELGTPARETRIWIWQGDRAQTLVWLPADSISAAGADDVSWPFHETSIPSLRFMIPECLNVFEYKIYIVCFISGGYLFFKKRNTYTGHTIPREGWGVSGQARSGPRSTFPATGLLQCLHPSSNHCSF